MVDKDKDWINITKSSIDELAKAIGNFIKSSGSASGSSEAARQQQMLNNGISEETDARERSTDVIENQTSQIQGQTIDAKKLAKAVSTLERGYISHQSGIKSTYEALHDFRSIIGNSTKDIKKQSSVLSGLLEGSTLSQASQDKFMYQMVQSSKSFKILN